MDLTQWVAPLAAGLFWSGEECMWKGYGIGDSTCVLKRCPRCGLTHGMKGWRSEIRDALEGRRVTQVGGYNHKPCTGCGHKMLLSTGKKTVVIMEQDIITKSLRRVP